MIALDPYEQGRPQVLWDKIGSYVDRLRNLFEAAGEYPTILATISGVGAAVAGIGIQETWHSGTRLWIAWLVGLVLFIALPAFSAKLNRLQQGRRSAKQALRKALAACAAAYSVPRERSLVRSNVMLLNAKHRRRVDSDTAFNMDGDPDCDLEIDATAGVSGEAFTHRLPAYGDLRLGLQPGGPSWGLRPAEKAKVRSDRLSILSVPVFDPDQPDGELLGTLQIDSDRTIEEMEFDVPERREIAQRSADVVALLLKTGR